MNARTMRTVWMVVIVLAAAALLAACGPTPEPTGMPTVAQPTQPPEPTAESTAVEPSQPPLEGRLFPPEKPSAVRGQEVFAANCVVCHGTRKTAHSHGGSGSFA
jgi:mono/diheme cytochrome c family protein